ncbi:MAG: hypothetical protein VX685_04665, partial [Actinomycetota bacterium]|nr:hypothetical protein [Actinomycetota bacterium]
MLNDPHKKLSRKNFFISAAVVMLFASVCSIELEQKRAFADSGAAFPSVVATNSQTQIASGIAHSCLLSRTGTVKCWGSNSFGQLGKDSTANLGDGTGEMAALGAINLGTNKSATAITAGDYHTCALLNDRTVKCWGLNSSGQLGRDLTPNWGDNTGEMAFLAAINLGTNKTAVAITAGGSHTCALLNDGTVKCWGLNSSGQLGKDSTANLGDGSGEMAALGAINLGTNKTAVGVSAGGSHRCALLNDGTVKCWGLNSSGQLGKDSTAALGDGTGEMA